MNNENSLLNNTSIFNRSLYAVLKEKQQMLHGKDNIEILSILRFLAYFETFVAKWRRLIAHFVRLGNKNNLNNIILSDIFYELNLFSYFWFCLVFGIQKVCSYIYIPNYSDEENEKKYLVQ